jgi:hypothetical protein
MQRPNAVNQPSEDVRQFWAMKPWWCQPWSIIGTGVVVLVGSWALFQRAWITAPLGAAVLTWWWMFLIYVPGLNADR